MREPYSPTPRASNNLERLIDRLTCKTCNGCATLTSSTSHFSAHQGAWKDVRVLRCTDCNGTGVQSSVL